MQKISVKKPKFLKNSLDPLSCSKSTIPSLLSSALTHHKSSQKSSFTTELRKITQKLGPILEKNSLKSPPSTFFPTPQSGLPFQRRARSSSPPKENLKLREKNLNLFPCGAPIIPSAFPEDSEDEELEKIKEEYFKMLEAAQDTRPTENEDTFEDDEYIETVMASLCFSKHKRK